MKVDTYLTWKDTRPAVSENWRAPVYEPRRRGVIGALSALAARLRFEA